MKNAKILALGLSMAFALSAGAASAVTSIGTNISTGGTLTVTGTSTLGIINSGTWNGTAIGVANGGTGATDAAGARTNLGLTIGTDVQAFSQGLLDIAGIAHASSSFIVSDGASWVSLDGAGARSALGLGSIATMADTDFLSVNGGNITGNIGLGTTNSGAKMEINDNSTSGETDTGILTVFADRDGSGGSNDADLLKLSFDPIDIGGGSGNLISGWQYGVKVFNLNSTGVITAGTWNGGSISDAYVDDNITASNYLPLGGGVLSGALTVSGVTGLLDADIPDTITASNYLPLGGGVLSGALTVSGVTGLLDADIPDTITASNYLLLTGGTLSGGLDISGAATTTGLVVNGNVTITGTLDAGVTTVTGLNLNSNILSLGVNLTATGTNSIELVSTGVTSLTLPTTGTLATLDGIETLTNKSLTSPTITGTPTASGSTWSDLGSVTTIDINGGTIDGTTIGATTPANGTFATGTFSEIIVPINTTPSTGDACATAGALRIDSDGASGSRIIWCDGANWQDN